MNNNHLYVLRDPRDSMVRYVGITDSPTTRYYMHLGPDRYNPGKTAWIQELKNLGSLPVMEVIQSDMSRSYAVHVEMMLIHELLAIGAPLLNVDRRRPFSHWTQINSQSPIVRYKVIHFPSEGYRVVGVVDEEKRMYRLLEEYCASPFDYRAYPKCKKLNDQMIAKDGAIIL